MREELIPAQAADLIKSLELRPHPEGGFYRETYRCVESIPKGALDARYSKSGVDGRSISTAIYFLLTNTSFSAMHRVASDEIYHWYAGNPIEVLLLGPDGTSRTVLVGNNVSKGEVPQLVIPRGFWQGSRVAHGGEFGLIGATVAPGFDFADFEMGTRSVLIAEYPDAAELITALTRS